MIVAKVGGSLYDHPALGPGLRDWVASAPKPVLLVPGGGPFVDVVRSLGPIHRLGEDAAHWLALSAMWAAAALLRELVPGSVYASHPAADAHPPDVARVLDAHCFCQLHNAVPRSWDVTADSIAAYAAAEFRADKLVLLKSIDVPPGTPWEEAAASGWVDPHFPRVVADHRLTVEAVHFRRWLDDLEHRPDDRGGTPCP